MFYPIYQLHGFDENEYENTVHRWEGAKNRGIRDLVLDGIRDGAGEHFLQWDFEKGVLKNFLEDECDLRGINIHGEDITFPEIDNFDGIDFKYAKFYHSTFRNGCFFSTSFPFAKIYNCKFINCRFSFTNWHGCTIENSLFQNCDFVGNNNFTNCNFINTKFCNYSINSLLFDDCRFDTNTRVDFPKFKVINPPDKKNEFNKKQLCDYYKSIYEAYQSGNVPELSRRYSYLARASRTDYLSKNWFCRVINKIFIEYLTGYGLKPIRPLMGAVYTIMFFSFIFPWDQGKFSKGLLLSLNAFITLGGASELSPPYNFLFLLESCLGIIFLGLFITVLCNVWFTEK